MPYIKIPTYEMGEVLELFEEEGISYEEVDGGTLDKQMIIEGLFENLGRITPEQFDNFIKTLK